MDTLKKTVTKTKSKRKKMKAFHQKVKIFRAKDPKMAVLMWGVSQSVIELYVYFFTNIVTEKLIFKTTTIVKVTVAK